MPLSAPDWLSPQRLAVYVERAAGDLSRGLDLYDWNAAVTAACLRDLGHFEVLIRNRYGSTDVRVLGESVAPRS